MHARLGQLFETLAAWARGQWTTVNRARLADILTNLLLVALNILDRNQILRIVVSLRKPTASVGWIPVWPLTPSARKKMQ